MNRPLYLAIAALFVVAPLHAQEASTAGLATDSVSLRLSRTDIRAAIQAIGRYLTKPVLTGSIGDIVVDFFETPRPVPRSDLPELLRGLAEANGLRFEEDTAFFRIVPFDMESPTPAAPNVVPQSGPIRLYTVRLRHARAADVSATLNQLFGAGGRYTRPGLSRATLSQELRADRRGREQEAGDEAERDTSLDGDVVIVPDELTNSLLIRATEGDYSILQQAIDELDVRPLQVLIELIAVEARKDRQFSLGFDLSVPAREVEGTGPVVEGGFGSAGLGDLVVRVMKLGKAEIAGTLAAARSRGDVEIVSRPVLVASNNTEAELLVGTQQPFVQVSRSLPTDTPQRDQVVQYRDVGTRLTVLPTINQDGYVSLLIQQEISSATGETQFDAPVIASRETSTQVLVADRQTVVIGGLRDRVQDEVRRGVPLLSELPILGGLFGSTKTRTTETELFLFITPTILATDSDAANVTRDAWPGALGGVGPEGPGRESGTEDLGPPLPNDTVPPAGNRP